MQLTRRLAADRVRAAGDSLDVYTRSLVEHSTEATEHDIAWLDRLIETERQNTRNSAFRDPRTPQRGRPDSSEGIQTMSNIRVAIAGVGNCASSLIQGVEYYRDADPTETVPGLMHVVLGGYHVRDLEFVAAFDADAAKVGTDLGKAIFAGQNNTIRFASVGELGVTVQRGPTLDGFGKYYRETVEESPGRAHRRGGRPPGLEGRRAGQLPPGRLRAGPALLRRRMPAGRVWASSTPFPCSSPRTPSGPASSGTPAYPSWETTSRARSAPPSSTGS